MSNSNPDLQVKALFDKLDTLSPWARLQAETRLDLHFIISASHIVPETALDRVKDIVPSWTDATIYNAGLFTLNALARIIKTTIEEEEKSLGRKLTGAEQVVCYLSSIVDVSAKHAARAHEAKTRSRLLLCELARDHQSDLNAHIALKNAEKGTRQ